MLEIIKAEYIDKFRIKVEFNTGTQGISDLQPMLWGEVFEPLKEPEKFKQFRLSNELGTIIWDTGADIAPEWILDNLENC